MSLRDKALSSDQHQRRHGFQVGEDCGLVRKEDLEDTNAPRFKDYPAKVVAASPRRLSPIKKQIEEEYRSEVSRPLEGPANYAGHYTVALYGCCSSCLSFAVIDRENGYVFVTKDFATVSGVHLYADDFEPRTASDSWGLRFVPDSKLLIVLGALDGDEQTRNGAFYYVLKGDQLKRVHSTIVKKNCPPR